MGLEKRGYNIKLDNEQLEKLLQMYPTKKYVATFFDCSEDTIDRYIKREYGITFAALRERAMRGAKRWLMANAFRMAARGSDVMQKFLMKNISGMSENPDLEVDQGKTFKLSYNLDDDETNSVESEIVDVEVVSEQARLPAPDDGSGEKGS